MSDQTPQPSSYVSEEEQLALLSDAQKVVAVDGFQMKTSLDNGDLIGALKFAMQMVSELRTSNLSPRNYYSLYMVVFDHLRHLENFLQCEPQDKSWRELYEFVQYAGNVVPRLYLLITVGSVYIRSKEVACKDILSDLVEMCRGVQHPTRGLFLRNYLSEMTKNLLPDSGNEYDGEGGTVMDSVEFVLCNFVEMNKLWVRLHQGPVKEKERREMERHELQLLVGKNLARLSQMDGVDVKLYKEVVLPKILDQVISCRDTIAQQYLMEIVIQIFPDEFHLATLDGILSTCLNLQSGVNLKTIVTSLADRLANFAAQFPDQIPSDVKMFEIFVQYIDKIQETRTHLSCEDFFALENSLLKLSLKTYPTEYSYVDQILGTCCKMLESLSEKNIDFRRGPCVSLLVSLLEQPLVAYNNVLKVLSLDNYSKLQTYLKYETRKNIQTMLLKNIFVNHSVLSTPEDVVKLFDFCHTFIQDEEGMPEIDLEDPLEKEYFEEEQNLIASTVHVFSNNEDPNALFGMYLVAKKYFAKGGPKRFGYTLTPLVFNSLKLVTELKRSQEDKSEFGKFGKRIFQFAHETVRTLAVESYSELALRLFLQCGSAASLCQFDNISYEFLSQAMSIYEDDISDSRASYNATILLSGILYTTNCFEDETYDTLVMKAAKYSAKLLKKTDQCRAVCLASNLFWKPQEGPGHYEDGKRVLECLQRALKIADHCMDASTNAHLFIDILNYYLHFFEIGVETVIEKYISGLIALINTNITCLDEEAENYQFINTYYQNTLDYLHAKKEEGDRYKAIDL